MSDRAEFEEWLSANVDDYDDIGSETLFECWQAARAQSGQGAEPESVPSRDDLVQCLLATRGQSEGVAADAILWLFPAATPQPEGYGWIKVGYEYQHEDTGQIGYVDEQQVEWGFFENNPRLQCIGPIYRQQPPQHGGADDE